MAELLVVRHGQAAFGADDYDVLSPLGARQAEAVAAHLAASGWKPDRVVTGTLARQRDTTAAMGHADPEVHPGFNEYDFDDLLYKSHGGAPLRLTDRRAHFRRLRETILAWQRDEVPDPGESWAEFAARVADALAFATTTEARRVLVVSSGGVIGQLVAQSLGAPDRAMIDLNLQIRNGALTRFLFSGGRVTLSAFNATPHVDADPALLSYS